MSRRSVRANARHAIQSMRAHRSRRAASARQRAFSRRELPLEARFRARRAASRSRRALPVELGDRGWPAPRQHAMRTLGSGHSALPGHPASRPEARSGSGGRALPHPVLPAAGPSPFVREAQRRAQDYRRRLGSKRQRLCVCFDACVERDFGRRNTPCPIQASTAHDRARDADPECIRFREARGCRAS